MSQDVWSTINPATTSGTQLATLLNDFKDAVMSGMSGTARPAETEPGGMWVDTTNEGTPNFYWKMMIYDGSSDIELFRVDINNNKVNFLGTKDSFNIERISADAIGPFLNFVKERIAANGQAQNNDVLGESRYTTADDAGTSQDVVSIRVEANQTITSSAQGVRMVWELIKDGASVLTEWMRLVNGRLGIGTAAPEAGVHTHNVGGLKSSVESDDAVGAKVTVSKGRDDTAGGVETSDVIGQYEFEAQDDDDAKTVTAMIEGSALENHTDTNKGTILKFKTATTGAASASSKLEVGDKVETKVTHKTIADEYGAQDVATTATINQLSGATRIVEFTGSTGTSLRGINSGHASKVITLHNRSSADVTIESENGGATAADQFLLPDGDPIILAPNHSAEFYYCTASTRWKLKARTSAGSTGGGGLSVETVDPSTDSPKTLSSGDSGKTFLVESANGPMVFVAPGPSTNLAFTIKDKDGMFDVNPCTLEQNSTEELEGVADDFVMESGYGYWQWGADGSNWFIVGR